MFINAVEDDFLTFQEVSYVREFWNNFSFTVTRGVEKSQEKSLIEVKILSFCFCVGKFQISMEKLEIIILSNNFQMMTRVI